MNERECAERAASMALRAKDCVRRYKLQAGGNGKRFMILSGLREHEMHTKRHITITEMARFSGLALPNVGRLIKPLEEEGLVCRRKQGRTVQVIITPKGDALLAAQREAFVRDITVALGALGEEEREAFLDCCAKLLARLEEHLQTDRAEEHAC